MLRCIVETDVPLVNKWYQKQILRWQTWLCYWTSFNLFLAAMSIMFLCFQSPMSMPKAFNTRLTWVSFLIFFTFALSPFLETFLSVSPLFSSIWIYDMEWFKVIVCVKAEFLWWPCYPKMLWCFSICQAIASLTWVLKFNVTYFKQLSSSTNWLEQYKKIEKYKNTGNSS